jgi:DNA-binding XRE family transcriptional regulator
MQKVADLAGCTKSSYGNIEKGRRSPSLETAKRIARALESTVDALFSNTTQPNSNTERKVIKTNKLPAVAAAELSEVPPSVMVTAAEDFQDGRADTEEGRRVLDLMQATGGPALG